MRNENFHIYNNTSDQYRMLNNARINEITFNKYSENCSIAKGIKVGSTFDEVKEAFGKTLKNDDYISITYSAKSGEIGYVIFGEDNKVDTINISFDYK